MAIEESGFDNDSTPTAAKIQELELQLEELRLQYTDRHPRIRQLVETIELLKAQAQRELAGHYSNDREGTPQYGQSLARNPVYQTSGCNSLMQRLRYRPWRLSSDSRMS